MHNMHRREEDISISKDENDEEEEAAANLPQHEQLERASIGIARQHSQNQDYMYTLHDDDGGGGRGRGKESHSSNSELRRLSLAVKGVHYAEFKVGRPLQTVKLAISINSPYSIFPCSAAECDNDDCGYGVPFNKDKSGTFRKVGCGGCGIGTSTCENNVCLESDDDWASYIARDYFVTNKGSIDITFGCQTFRSGFLDIIEETANGILGLATASTSHVNQLNRAQVIETSMFSLCFRRYPFTDPNHSALYESAGTLDLGGYDSTYLTSPVVWMTNTGKKGKYTAELKNVYLREGGGLSVQPDRANQKIVKLDFDKIKADRGAGTVIETTSPVTLLNVAVQEAFKLEFFRMTGKAFSYEAMQLSDAEVLKLPTILIQLKTTDKNQSQKPDDIVGMVGTELDPNSPTDVLLAIPAVSYLHKREDGLFKSLLSVNHQNGSVLGSNAFQGRHIVFTTGYSSDSSKIGIAETEKCTSDDPDFSSIVGISGGTDPLGTNPPTPSPQASVLTFAPTVSPKYFSPNYPIADSRDAFDFWPIVVAGVLFVAAVVILLLTIAIRRNRLEKKTDEDETGDSDGSYDAGSFVSYGLRSHLFSITASSKQSGGNANQGAQSANNNNNPTLENARMMDIEASAGLIRSERQQTQQQNVQKQEPLRAGNPLSREPLLPQAQPIQTQVVHAQPVYGENQRHDVVRKKSSSSDRSDRNKNSGKLFKSRRSTEFGVAPQRNPSSNTDNNNKTEKTFLVKRGVHDSSEEEHEHPGQTREMARRQLQMLVGKRGSDPLVHDRQNRDQAKAKGAVRRQTMSTGTRVSNKSSNRRDTMNMIGADERRNSRERRPTMNMVGADGRRNSRERRPTMDMKYTDERRTSKERRATMDMNHGDHRQGQSSMERHHTSKNRSRRATMNMSSHGHTLDSLPTAQRVDRRATMAHGVPNKQRQRRQTMDMAPKPSSLPSVHKPKTTRTGQSRQRRPTMDLAPKPESFTSLEQSKATMMSKTSKKSRSSKVSRQLSSFEKFEKFKQRAGEQSRPLTNELQSQHRAEPDEPYAHPAVSTGTVIHVAEESSVVSGLTYMAIPTVSKGSRNISGASKHQLSSSRHSSRRHSIGTSGHDLEYTNRRGSSVGRRGGSIGAGSRTRSLSQSRHNKRYSSESENSSKFVSNESFGRGTRYSSRESLSSYGQSLAQSNHNQMSGTSDEDTAGVSRRSSDIAAKSRRPSLLMATIKEDPSKRSMGSSNRQMHSAARKGRGTERDQLDREIQSRGLPAAPSYRIMPRGNNSMW